MTNKKFEQRRTMLEQKIQELSEQEQKDLFKEIKLKEETFFKQLYEGKLNISKIYIMQERLNLNKEELSFIFIEEELYSEEQKQKDFKMLRDNLSKQSNELKDFTEGLIAILNKATTIQQRDKIFSQIKKSI